MMAVVRCGVRRARRAVLLVILLGAGVSSTALAGQPSPLVVDIQFEQEGQVVTDALLTSLVVTSIGQPLSIRDVRETTGHFLTLNRFEDVQSFSEAVDGGVRLRYVLFPLHEVDRIEFRGALGLSEGTVRSAIVARFGEAPPASRAGEVEQLLRFLYRDRGYPGADISTRIEEFHDPDRATMVLLIEAGRRATISQVEFEQADLAGVGAAAGVRVPNVRRGQAYDTEVVAGEITRYEEALRERGYYEARATQSVEFDADGNAAVIIAIDRGPLVAVEFSGDPLSQAERDRLVPIRAEASVDEDLLEDANRSIEQYLFVLGFRDAVVDYSRDELDGLLTVTFDVRRGQRHIVNGVAIAGGAEIASADVQQFLGIRSGELFVQETLDDGLATVRAAYRARGFIRADVQAVVTEVSETAPPEDADHRVRVVVVVMEGPRTVIGSMAFGGHLAFSDDELSALVPTSPGQPLSTPALTNGRDAIAFEYRNRGYEDVVVNTDVLLVDDETRADVRFSIVEGQQAIVDHIIVTGNQRTSAAMIERELLLRPGEPLGYTAMLESRARLGALGLFRRITIESLAHPGEPRRDVLVRVEEAPPTTLGYGGGVEGGTRLRPTGVGGQAEERFEVAPRGFFEIGRRNMWGKNRSVNLFTRASLRSRDVIRPEDAGSPERLADGSGYGLNEYRVLGTFREPRVFGTAAEFLLTGIIDQAIRSSFSFRTREVRAEVGLRMSTFVTLAARYSFEHTSLFDERFRDEDRPPLIDRVFPQVRLSKISPSFVRDTRDDILQPSQGRLLVTDVDLATRGLGSEVGFVKTYLQAFSFHRLPSARRIVLALGARLGLARGFRREKVRIGDGGEPVLGPDGQPVIDVVEDLPASERFFAGGDNTVRGFSLDRLGNSETISPSGFPTGGNGVVVLNAELRTGITGPIDAVTFFDAGNVYHHAGDVDFGDLRPAAGFGVHYRSPVGPVRVELGFNLDRRELLPGQPDSLERQSVLHISLGSAF